ncbi:MAG TPA: acylphosphatase [Pseudolysinimonas sp.]
MRRRVVISGRVQGVGLRWSAAAEAERLGVSGSIRNLQEGYVQAEISGEPDAVEQFTEWLRVGPPTARVDDLVIEELLDLNPPPTGFRIE